MEENRIDNSMTPGNVNISDEVVSIVACLAATGIPGVAGMSGSLVSGFAEFLGKKNVAKGVKVIIEEKNVDVELYIIVEYGARIPDVAWQIQEKVKSEVESMTGLNVTAVDVHVEGVNVPKETKIVATEPVEAAVEDEIDE